MPPDNLISIGVILAAAFLGAFIKGVTTMGLNLIAVPVIALFLDVQTAVLSVFLSKFLSDILMLVQSKKGFTWRSSLRLSSFIISGAIAIPAATYLLANATGRWLDLFLGFSILAFVAYQLHPRPLTISRHHETGWGTAFGIAAGTTQGLSGVGGPYTAIYLYSLRLTTTEFVFLSSVIYLLFDFSQIGAVLSLKLYDQTRLFYAVITIIPVMAGTWLGIRLRGRLNPKMFKRSLLVLLVLSAGSLLARGAGV